MSIPVQSLKQSATLSSGTLETLEISFTFQNPTYIKIFINEIQISGFTILNNTITFSPALTAPSNILVYYDVPFNDIGDFVNSEQWISGNVNTRFNLLALQIQKLYEKIGIVFPDNEKSTTQNAQLPNDRANKLIYYNNIKDLDLLSIEEITTSISGEINEAVENAEGSAASASSSANAAGLSENAAIAAANVAIENSYLAQDWAEKSTDVTPGHPSAKTWAETASEISIPNGSIGSNKINYDCNFTTLEYVNNALGNVEFCDFEILYGGTYQLFVSFLYQTGSNGRILQFEEGNTTIQIINNITVDNNGDGWQSAQMMSGYINAGEHIKLTLSGVNSIPANVQWRLAIVRVS